MTISEAVCNFTDRNIRLVTRIIARTTRIASVVLIAGILSAYLSPMHAATADLSAAISAYEAQDYATAHKLFLPAAKDGSPNAQYHLGMMYRFAWGVDKDFKVALDWFGKAAAQSHAPAQSELGKMYKDGRGVERDAKQAAVWFRKAAEGGLGVAQLNLARMYRAGKGVPKDAKQAYVWFSLAISNQYMDAIGHRRRLMSKMSAQDIEAAKEMTKAQRAKINK